MLDLADLHQSCPHIHLGYERDWRGRFVIVRAACDVSLLPVESCRSCARFKAARSAAAQMFGVARELTPGQTEES